MNSNQKDKRVSLHPKRKRNHDSVTFLKDGSIKKQVLTVWMEKPFFKPKKICHILRLDYQQHGNYVRNLLSQFRCNQNLAYPKKPILHKRSFVWFGVGWGFAPKGETLKNFGWRQSCNQNGHWVFKSVDGSVQWFKNGTVMLHLKGELLVARAKELFSKAFGWFPKDLLVKFLDVPMREHRRHWVFEVGSPLPRFYIDRFKASHGLAFYSDGSHPTSVEVEETQPFWLGSLENVCNGLAGNIKAHLELIEIWKREAEQRRGCLHTNYLVKNVRKVMDDSSVPLNASMVASMVQSCMS